MRNAQQRVLIVKVCLSLIVVVGLSISRPLVAADNAESPRRKLVDDNSGFISIDCGVTVDYIDTNTGIWYQPDTGFVETGKNYVVSPGNNIDNPYFGKQLSTLRSFPDGIRNCYVLNPKQGKNNNYLIRAFFAYGNYEGKNKVPSFDLYIGVYYWDTIQVKDSYYYSEINYTPSTNTVYVCLVNTGLGTPFISSLELRPLNNSIYQTVPTSLRQYLQGRYGLGIPSEYNHIRYKDDIYDRIWNTYGIANTAPFNRSVDVDTTRNDDYRLPAEVLTTAVQPLNRSNTMDFIFDYETSFEYYVYLHFLEIEQLPSGQKRTINIIIDDQFVLPGPISLEFMKPLTISSNYTMQGHARFSVSASAKSELPPILNALEIFRVPRPTNPPTDTEDANAVLEIKQIYGISIIDWQGDPCVPSTLSWTGLSCSADNNPRIISMNLSSNKLTGKIATSFLNLTRLESLDLSNNELTGSLPEFLAEMPYLKILNLSENKLTGSIPKALKEKLDNKTLLLSLDGNSGFCLKGSCKRKKFVVPLVISIAALIIITLCAVIIWRFQRKRQHVTVKQFKEKGSVKLKSRAYSYAEVIDITDNFKTIIGEGGFGKVYFGTLPDDTQVVVKLLSLSSKQGYKAFQSEAELLMSLHHRNIVSLMGHCDEGEVKALIYEYMDNGNLHHNLSKKAPNVLDWKERLQIAIDAAYGLPSKLGLDYLHNGCKPPIIHRDLKTSNILLNAKMQAKIADFGLSRAFANDTDSYILTHHAGTPGYLDPQFQISKKSDIYSFGIILFELITGQPVVKRTTEGAIHILHWVMPEVEKGDIINIIDQRLQRKYIVASMQKAINVAMACVATAAVHRPNINLVLAELKECLSLEMVLGTNSSIFYSQITEAYAR